MALAAGAPAKDPASMVEGHRQSGCPEAWDAADNAVQCQSAKGPYVCVHPCAQLAALLGLRACPRRGKSIMQALNNLPLMKSLPECLQANKTENRGSS